ncbi:peptide/nickel transport system permease protein [Paracoccus isoporae]|uniref:Peptide/nickel transport system permease protein n=1 Tax=Paracoccus isoporae TaxID=591205 RepID=A0A1G7CHV9_9RHOB|nr:ABC transporter permease [Paracoccus isoporae]SDE38879.1 peptide/nickel transport system permease protein [Paracoccus isoporae]
MSRGTLWVGLLLVGLNAGVALLTLFWLPYDPTAMAGGRLQPPSWAHPFGTDRLGQDYLTKVMIGARIALSVGIGAAALGGLIGTCLGVLAAFARRSADDGLAATLDILIAFPTLLLAMLVVAASEGASLGTAILAIGLAMSAIIARLVRILTKRVLAQDYITAARCSGLGWGRIVVSHVLPNILPTVLVAVALQFGLAVIAEASLSFLGLGTPPPNASWGQLLQQAQSTVFRAPMGVIAPGLALISLVLGINFLADGLRDLLDAEVDLEEAR